MKPMPFRHRFTAAWKTLRGDIPASSHASQGQDIGAADEARLAAEAAVAAKRLEAEKARRRVEQLRRELDAERAARSDALQAAVAARLEPALTDAAALLGQLALQARLIEEGNPVEARDVMALARGLSRLFERQGLAPIAAVGEMVSYDPARHHALGGTNPLPGSEVVVRIPGYRIGEKILRKPMVEPTRPE